MPDTDADSLRATYGRTRPPWIGYWSKRDCSNMRKAWWTELGVTDELTNRGVLAMVKPQLRETHRDYWDPKVPDGTSLAGPMGLDSTRYPNLTAKGDQPGQYNQFLNKLYKSTTQYKDIAAAYDLSEGTYPFHKGFQVPLTNNSRYEYIAKPNMPWWYPRLMRFFDKPLNQDPIMKGLAMGQYAAIAMIPYTILDLRANDPGPSFLGPKKILSRYFHLTPIPATLAFTWGITLSTAAMVRQKDDFTNHYFSSAAVGLVLATMKDNFAAGFSIGAFALLSGMFWQYCRVSEAGVQNKVSHLQTGSYFGGPLFWKLKWFGEEEVPTKQY